MPSLHQNTAYVVVGVIISADPPEVSDKEQEELDNKPASEPILVSEIAEFDSADSRANRRRQPLYGAFYGLSEPPFDLTPNPKFLFLSHRQREALGNLRYALATSKGFTMILGEAGTGKTTLVRTAMAELGDTNGRYVLISNPTLGRAEFYEVLAREFGLSDAAAHSKTQFLSELQADVEARFAAGGLTGLIVDEAQSLPHELLEEIRLLGNIETTTTKLLNIVLCGQPELAARLNESSLRQLKQRLALRCELKPLTADETMAYVSGRLRIAGGDPVEIFTLEAVLAVHEAASGIPRTINVLCDNALISGFATQLKPIRESVIEQVCRDFDLDQPSSLPAAPPAPPAPPPRPVAAKPTAPGAKPERPKPLSVSKKPVVQEREILGWVSAKKRRFIFFS